MTDDVSDTDLARELGIHEHVLRSHLREFFADEAAAPVPEALTRARADEFLAWHATRYGTAG